MTQSVQSTSASARAAAHMPVFSGKLYLDTLRRLRLMGLTLILLAVGSVLLELLSLFSYPSDPYYLESALLPTNFGDFLLPLTLFGPVALMVQAFYFLYRRQGSDFYHSLPCSRLCLGVSIAAAALTWFYAALVLGIAVCAAVIPFTHAVFRLPMLAWMLGTYGATGALVAACALIGLSLSGTPLAGLLIGGLTLYLPRFALTVYRTFVVYSSGMMVYGDAGAFLSPGFHLPTMLLVLYTRPGELPRTVGATASQMFANGPAILYTACLALLGLAWGLRLFVKRKSELAGQDLARPLSRYALRAAVAAPGLLYAAYLAYRYKWDVRLLLLAVAVLLAAFLGVTRVRAKSWRLTGYAAACMLLACALTGAVTWGGLAAGKQTRTDLPHAADIVSVTFPAKPGNNHPLNGYVSGYSLDASLVGDVAFSHREIRALAARALADNAAALDAQEEGDYFPLPHRPISLRLELTDGQILERTVRLTDALSDLLARRMASSPEMMKALRMIPDDPRFILYGLDTNHIGHALPAAMTDTLRADLDALDDAAYLRHTSLRGYMPAEDMNQMEYPPNIQLNVYAWRGVDLMTRSIPVGPTLPNTDALCNEALISWYADSFRHLTADLKPSAEEDESRQVYYTFAFIKPVEYNGYSSFQHAYLSSLTPWHRAYGEPYYNAPDREMYETIRVEEEALILPLLTGAPFAQRSGPNVVQARIQVSTLVDRARNLYEHAESRIYLQLTDQQMAELAAFHTRREEQDLPIW